MAFDVKEDEGIIIITIPERLDASNSQELKDIINEKVTNKKFKFIIDLSKTNFVDSSGLGAMVSKIAHCRANDGDVKVVIINERIKEIFQITHLDKVLKQYKTVKEALNSFKEN